MAIALHYKGYFLRIIPSGRSDLASCVLVQISRGTTKPFVEIYCGNGSGLSRGLRWIDSELPQLSGTKQGLKNTDIPQSVYPNVLKAQELMAVLKSSVKASERNIDFALSMLIRSRKLSAISRPPYARR